jgi:hypothetical protein
MSSHLTLLELDALAEAGPSASVPHLEGCERCRNELELMRSAQERFRSGVFARTAPEIARKLAPQSIFSRWRWALPLVLAPALAAVLLVAVFTARAPRVEPDLGVKGAATLRLLVQHDSRVFEAQDGAELAAGDALRFQVQPGGFPYLLVGSVDARGETGILFPVDARESGRIDPMAQVILPGSAVLDDASGPERAFVILSAQPISADAAEAEMRELARGGPAALRTATALPHLGAGAQLSVHWEKRSP